MGSSRTARAAVTAAALMSMVLLGRPALADPITLFDASDFFIPRPASATDQEGVERLIASFDLAANGQADLIGQECQFTVLADNGDSVNESNYAILRTDGAEVLVYDTESQPDVTSTVLSNDLVVLGPTVEMFNVMEPGPTDIVGTSVDFTVTVDCSTSVTTSTTGSTTTSTSSTSSSTSSTSSTTTTTPDPGITTTTAQVTTSTTDPGSSISDSSSTTVPPTAEGTLPFTGSGEEAGLSAVAAGLMVLGAAGVLAARPRGRHSR